jgi:hypothetical protein
LDCPSRLLVIGRELAAGKLVSGAEGWLALQELYLHVRAVIHSLNCMRAAKAQIGS